MDHTELNDRLKFIRRAEGLKDTLRSAHTTAGRTESVAEHSWRLCLIVITFADQFPELDLLQLLKICILHDVGEAVSGDIPAPEQDASAPKSDQERADFRSLIEPLPAHLRTQFLALWDEYEYVKSEEAVAAKALDKIETLIQHTQGKNPADFDYTFNLSYGKKHTDSFPLAAQIRKIVDAETADLAEKSETSGG